ncbi:MAG: glycosyltransferase family 2 protein, partial [Gemmataceae bacterium]|nr:glycosyltransferase family 2 protein [Gemmataceae bacterium]
MTPAAVAVESRGAPRPSTCQPMISVIVPVRNEAAALGRTLDQLLAQDYDRFEVIVVDGRSTDATRDIVRQRQVGHAHLTLLDNPRRLSSAARNIGLRAARGDYVVIVDGHCDVPDEGYLRRVAEAFARSGADCLGRPQPLEIAGGSVLQRAIAAARRSWLGHNPASYIYSDHEGFVAPDSVAVAYRRSVFTRIGEFDERFDACEDVEFNYRARQAGLTCWFTPQIAVHYHPRKSLPRLFRQMARYGRGRVRLLRKHPGSFSLGCFLPALLTLWLAIGWWPSWFLSGGLACYVASAFFYAATLLTGAVGIALVQRDAALLPRLPVVLATIHLGAGAGILF